MAIRIPPKFGSKLPPPEPSKNNGKSIFQRINEKRAWERENIEPHLGDLFPLFRDECIIFENQNNIVVYVGRNGFGWYKNRNEDYRKIGEILAKI